MWSKFSQVNKSFIVNLCNTNIPPKKVLTVSSSFFNVCSARPHFTLHCLTAGGTSSRAVIKKILIFTTIVLKNIKLNIKQNINLI